MKISELEDGMVVRLRTGRAGRDEVEWGFWREAELYVQKFMSKKTKKQEIGIISIKNEGWAEYNPKQDFSNGTFLAEDYYMEIEGVTER